MMLRLEVFKSKFKETVPSPSSVEHVEKTKAWVQQEGSGAHPWPWPWSWSSEMTCPPLSLALKELRYVYCNVLKGFYSFQVWWFYGQTLAHHLVVWLVEAWTGLWVAVAQLSCRTPNETNRNWIEFKCLMDVIRHCFQVILKSIKWPPLMELLWGDESCPGVAVPEVTGLPPRVILHADNLEDVAPVKGYSCILARNGGILIRIVVKKSLHKQLRKENHLMFLPSNRQTGDKGKYDILYVIYFIYWFILLFSYRRFVNFLCILAVDITSLSGAFSHMSGNIFVKRPWS